jgi:TBC1 domain family protein 5
VINVKLTYQGMHELLASILMIIDLDSLPPLPTSSSFLDPISRQAPELVSERAMHATLSRDHVEHDAFTLFSSLMKAGKSWYEWRAEEGPRIPGRPITQAPIIALCNHMQGELLRRIDPQLWERLETEGVEAQIWGM